MRLLDVFRVCVRLSVSTVYVLRVFMRTAAGRRRRRAMTVVEMETQTTRDDDAPREYINNAELAVCVLTGLFIFLFLTHDYWLGPQWLQSADE